MRRAGLLVAAAVLAASAVACGSSSDDGKDSSVPYGAQTCSDWAGHMSSSEHWDAATELLTNAHGADGADDSWTPSTGAVKQFESDLGTLCDRGSSGDLLATLADHLYESNRAFYSI